MDKEMSEKEAEELLRQFSENKSNSFSFFTNVIKTDDTTRLGNLLDEELGNLTIPLRTCKELALFSKDIANDDGWGNYFNALGEIQTSTSLSRAGFLLRLVQTTKKELADVTPSKKKNKGWFKSKNDNSQQVQV